MLVEQGLEGMFLTVRTFLVLSQAIGDCES